MWQVADRTETASAFIQDTWTRGRLTLQGALRYDRAWSFSPAEGNGTTVTSRFNAAPITFPRTDGVNAYNDLTPRFGAAYDVFGNGKTAIKFNLGHYLAPATNDSRYTLNNPAATAKIVTTVRANLGRRQRQLRGRLRHPEPRGAKRRRAGTPAARSRATR